jgi:isoleucyl-tRNA synthetase
MAEDGQKMSKSLGNVIAPQNVIDQYGADILRIWVVNSDYSDDLRIGPEIIKQQADIYRRLRNTLRFLLGNLSDFDDSERITDVKELPELERWVLHRIHEMDGALRKACNDFDFQPFFAELHTFCAVDLSAFYFDVRKDALYCGRTDSAERRAARTVLDTLFNHLTAWLAPVLCFTAEEAWLSRNPDTAAENSVHLRGFPDVPGDWHDETLAAKWSTVRNLRRAVTGALEVARANKEIGASLQAHPQVFASADVRASIDGIDPAELCITSAFTFVDGDAPDTAHRHEDIADIAVVVEKASGEKCDRCWKILDEVGSDAEHPSVCNRCADAVRHAPPAAA